MSLVSINEFVISIPLQLGNNMKQFFNILSILLVIYFFLAMIGTDDVGEKIENATIAILCYLDVLARDIFSKSKEVPN